MDPEDRRHEVLAVVRCAGSAGDGPAFRGRLPRLPSWQGWPTVRSGLRYGDTRTGGRPLDQDMEEVAATTQANQRKGLRDRLRFIIDPDPVQRRALAQHIME